ncbi:MAG: ATP-binding protein [Lentisphaerae bacterium]|jgi:AAA15 family ATPase/GTPase|nr:ATP-binding protein [Lentisphaerota bacterium]
MIISFAVENWMSFRDRTSLLMTASRERQHGNRVSTISKYKTRVLPIAAIYGGNASGKTNFFKALNFAKVLVVKGTQPDSLINVEPFRLDRESASRPSRFFFELLIGENVYEFSFAVTRKAVLEEKLVLISSASEKVLYSRKGGEITFDGALEGKQKDFLNFVSRGTRDNQLFLTNSISQNVDDFRSVYDWFKEKLVLIAPDSRFEAFEQFIDEQHPLYSTMNTLLQQLDTGIAHLGGEEVPFDQIPFPESLKTMLQGEVKEGKTFRVHMPLNDRYVVTREDGNLTVKKLVAYHQVGNGPKVRFGIRHESDGSQRVIDLLPAFLELSDQHSSRVYVIDEVDRSLHTMLTRRLLETYLASCAVDTRTQVLLTTHDVMLMDQQLLRRDEMWVAERNADGASSLLSFSDYKDVRYDKDIRKSYLQGRLGGIPRILLNVGLGCHVPLDKNKGGN